MERSSANSLRRSKRACTGRLLRPSEGHHRARHLIFESKLSHSSLHLCQRICTVSSPHEGRSKGFQQPSYRNTRTPILNHPNINPRVSSTWFRFHGTKCEVWLSSMCELRLPAVENESDGCCCDRGTDVRCRATDKKSSSRGTHKIGRCTQQCVRDDVQSTTWTRRPGANIKDKTCSPSLACKHRGLRAI